LISNASLQPSLFPCQGKRKETRREDYQNGNKGLNQQLEGGVVTMANHPENGFAEVGSTCSGLNLPMEKAKGKKRRAGLFYLPPSVHPWKCDHIFETEDGFQHIIETTSIAAT